MQPRRVMLLNHEAPPLRRRNCAIAARFGGFAEIAVRLVAGKTTTRHRAPGRSFMQLAFCSATNLINLSSYSVDILLGHESGQSFHMARSDQHRACQQGWKSAVFLRTSSASEQCGFFRESSLSNQTKSFSKTYLSKNY